MRAVLSTVCMRVLMGLSVVVRHRVAVHVVVWFIVLALPLLADSWTFLGMFVVLLMVLDLVVILVVLQVLICATSSGATREIGGRCMATDVLASPSKQLGVDSALSTS